jgi:hypothetical protein
MKHNNQMLYYIRNIKLHTVLGVKFCISYKNLCISFRKTEKRIEIYSDYTGCPTYYWTQHFFNNSNTNEYIATKFEQQYVRCVRNEKECVCSVCLFRCNILIGVRIIKEMPVSVAGGTACRMYLLTKLWGRRGHCLTEGFYAKVQLFSSV